MSSVAERVKNAARLCANQAVQEAVGWTRNKGCQGYRSGENGVIKMRPAVNEVRAW